MVQNPANLKKFDLISSNLLSCPHANILVNKNIVNRRPHTMTKLEIKYFLSSVFFEKTNDKMLNNIKLDPPTYKYIL